MSVLERARTSKVAKNAMVFPGSIFSVLLYHSSSFSALQCTREPLICFVRPDGNGARSCERDDKNPQGMLSNGLRTGHAPLSWVLFCAHTSIALTNAVLTSYNPMHLTQARTKSTL